MISWWAWLGAAGIAAFMVLALIFIWCGLQDDGRDRSETDYD